MPDIFVAGTKEKTDKSRHPAKHQPAIESPEIVKHSVHLFSSFCENPGDITFKNQDKNEQVLLFVRKHFITNFLWITTGVFLLILPLFVGPISAVVNLPIPFFSAKYLLFFTLFYYLVVISYLFIRFITWYFNVSLVTDIRIVDIDFSDVVYKNLAATKLSLVQDVSYTQTGVLRTVFHYGDVLVQTAGETTHFDFDAVPQPEKVVHIIGGLIGKHGTV